MIKPSFVSSGLACVLMLAGCGGGGGGNAPPANPAPPANAAPSITSSSFAATEETDLAAQLAATDANGDALTFASTSNPSRGTLVSLTAGGAFVYRPNPNAFGADTFNISVSDGRGGTATATITINVANVNDPVGASDDRIQLTAGNTLTVAVLANDSDPDNDGTLSIIDPALVGTASVAVDRTVTLSGIPNGFRGLTRFRYRLTDSGGAFTDAWANVFVGTAPFRAIVPIAGWDFGITDFTGEPRTLNGGDPALTNVGSIRPAANGTVVAYHRTAPGATTDRDQVCAVRTAAGSAPQCFQIPDNRLLFNLPPNRGRKVYEISRDGRWIAVVLVRSDLTVTPSLYLIDTSNPTVATQIGIPGAEHAVLPTFSYDSTQLFFIANNTLSNDGLAVYRRTLSTGATVRMSLAEDAASHIDGFAVSRDGTRLVFQRVTGNTGVYYVDTNVPGTEHLLSQINAGSGLQWMQGNRAFANPNVTTVSYVVWRSDNVREVWMADVSSTAPAPRAVGEVPANSSAAPFPVVRPDGQAVLYNWGTNFTSNFMVYEASRTSSTPVIVSRGVWGGYDSTGDTIVVQHYELTPTFSTLQEFRVVTRATFGSPVKAGSQGFQNTSSGDLPYNDRGAFVFGEGASLLGSMRPVLVNTAAPGNPLLLSADTIDSNLELPRYYLVD